MEPGAYEVWEQSVPENYILDTEHQHITLEPNKVGTVQFQNHQRPTLVIKKVDLNGKLLPCERIGHQFALGKVTAEGIDLNPEAIADTYNHYYAQMEDRCATCRNSRACIQCLFNLPHPEKNPVCHGYMDENRFRRLEAQQLYFLSKHPEAYRKIMEKVIRM